METMRTIAPAVALVLLAAWLVPNQAWAALLAFARELPGLALAGVIILVIATVVFIRSRGATELEAEPQRRWDET